MGPEEIEKKNLDALLQEKNNSERPSRGKKAFSRKNNLEKAVPCKKINSFSIFPPSPPRSLMVDPLIVESDGKQKITEIIMDFLVYIQSLINQEVNDP